MVACPSPPPAPEKGREMVSDQSEMMEDDPTVPAAMGGEVTLALPPHSQDMEAKRSEDRKDAGAVAMATQGAMTVTDSCRNQGTLSQGCYVFSEAELVTLQYDTSTCWTRRRRPGPT